MNRLLRFSVILLVSMVVLLGCNSGEQSLEMIAFNSLSEGEQNLIPVSPKDSVIEKIDVTLSVEKFLDDEYDKSEVYLVTFNNTESESNGNLIVFIDVKKPIVVGKGYSDK